MSDLVLTHFDEIIDNHAIGHNFLQTILGAFKTDYFWGIDCFGFTKTSAYLMSRMGMQAIFINRIFEAQKKHFFQRNMRKFVWQVHNDTFLYVDLIKYRYNEVPYTIDQLEQKTLDQWANYFEQSKGLTQYNTRLRDKMHFI